MAIFKSKKTGTQDQVNSDRSSNEHDVEKKVVPGYGHERGAQEIENIEADNPNVHQHFNFKLFMGLVCMSFLWCGSQIPLYLFGGVLPLLYSDVGGSERFTWLVIGYLIPNAALCPFVGALSDMFGRRMVAIFGQVCLVVGAIVVSTSHTMNTAIGGMVISGLGAGLNELIALAGTAEMVPVQKRGAYVGLVVFTILPFAPSVLWAQLIAQASSWRYVGILVGSWNFIGLLLLLTSYRDPVVVKRPAKEILREVDYVGGFLSTVGVVLFMMGMQFGASQYEWTSAQVLVPFLLGVVFIIAFFVWEVTCKYPMAPKHMFSKDKRTMIAILIVTFFSGGNFFVVLLFWPTQIYNVYGDDPLGVGIRSLPIGFGIIGGAAIGLVLLSVTKGRSTVTMIISCAIMTAGTGAVSISRPDNLMTTYGVVTLASLGVGAVIIPCSIIAQIVCPPELIGTITAITLSIRYIGGAIGFSAYYNVFYSKLFNYATVDVGPQVVINRISYDYPTLETMITMAAYARWRELREFIMTAPNVNIRDYDFVHGVIVPPLQESFALAYRYPYWMSIAFGGICLISSLFLRDVSKYYKF
ncbi:MFS general substrate transporter [Pseudovirgaria hyperparasitica]|uniref:MFS general substrate transporter n=1 Tax=Pseudovirgaria hyperparasitica TaxID=470096 RepID=A0A6A6VUN2_9PEZI|nr:MFS general substrate transporter [Pseudovirgaria hyperparasitica]KAF2753320.1 MFS general substrate transporter [Pseudovirgaria hyperparasitica]